VPLQLLDSMSGGVLSLDLSSNSLHELPRSVGMCAFLRTLKLRGNILSALPPSTKQLKTLTHLDISGEILVKASDRKRHCES
jgi:Leucine-rich repeat (LRR) protein